MEHSISDLDFLKEVYNTARNKYRPRHIRVLLIVEAPPCALERFFYFGDVKKQDSLFLEIIGILYPRDKDNYLKSGRDTFLKEQILEKFKSDGYWLMDLSEVPTSIFTDPLEGCVPSLLTRLEKYIDKSIPIVLIKTNVYDVCYAPLRAKGYHVINERMPFPGSGQQKVFRDKFEKALKLC
jgi:hypothetical protein